MFGCNSCNRPPLPDWLIAVAIGFVALLVGSVGWFFLSMIWS